MGSPTQGVSASWCTTANVTGLCPFCNALTAQQLVVLAQMIPMASDYLFERTARRWPGLVSSMVVRPAVRSIGDGSPLPRHGSSGVGSLGSFDYRYGGVGGGIYGFRAAGSPLTRNGSGVGLSEITLGAFPVVTIQQVKVDGVVLAGSAYRLDDNRWLVRIDGKTWPVAQDMTQPDTAVGTFSVTFDYGIAPPRGGVQAAASLACELTLLSTKDSNCRFPKRIQSLARNGTTINVNDPAALFKDGLTGLPDVDLFINTYNPQRLQRRASVFSPDLPRPVRHAGT